MVEKFLFDSVIMPSSGPSVASRGLGDVNPTIRFAVQAIRHHQSHKSGLASRHGPSSTLATDAHARGFVMELVKDRIITMGATRVTNAIVRKQLATSLNGSSIRSLLRQMYETPFGRSVIHHISGHPVMSARAEGAGSAGAIAVVYEKMGTNAIASMITMLLRCGWDLMEVLMGKKQWLDLWKSFVIAVGGTAGGVVGWTASAALGGGIAAAAPWMGPRVAGSVGAVCAFLGTLLGDYVAGAGARKFFDWFLGPDGREGKLQDIRGRVGKGAAAANMTPGERKRERSGEGRSSREAEPRRPLPPHVIIRLEQSAQRNAVRSRQRGSADAHGKQPRRREEPERPKRHNLNRSVKIIHNIRDLEQQSDSDSDLTYEGSPWRMHPDLSLVHAARRRSSDLSLGSSSAFLLREHASPARDSFDVGTQRHERLIDPSVA